MGRLKPATRWVLLIGISVTALSVTASLRPIPMPLAYHNFADQREMFGIANALDVLSNVPFFVVGVLGLYFALHRKNQASKSSQAARILGKMITISYPRSSAQICGKPLFYFISVYQCFYRCSSVVRFWLRLAALCFKGFGFDPGLLCVHSALCGGIFRCGSAALCLRGVFLITPYSFPSTSLPYAAGSC